MRALLLSFSLILSQISFSQEINRAYLAFAQQSSLGSGGLAERAVDGDTNGQWSNGSVTHTQSENDPWWQCDMGEVLSIKRIQIWNRTDCCNDRLQSFYVFVSESPFGSKTLNELLDDSSIWNGYYEGIPDPSVEFQVNTSGRYVRVQLDNDGSTPLSLAEVEVWSDDTGKERQFIEFSQITKKRTDSSPFELSASSDAGLEIDYSITSGPATLEDHILILDGTPGIVTVRAEQMGNNEYYAAAPREQSFEVVDPATVIPSSRIVSLSEEYPIYMPEIKAIQLVASGSIDHTDLFDISDFYFEVNGTRVEATLEEGLYSCWWEPSEYTSYDIKAIITGSNGIQNEDFLSVEIVKDAPNYLISSFDKVHVSPSSQRITQSFNFPSQVGAYFDMIAILDITCPGGGACDPWDRLAWVEARWPGGEWKEIIRYITPYGVPCQHIIDVSEYASILQGEVELRVYIGTWQTGFEVSLDFILTPGSPPYAYAKVTELWEGAYNFGNLANLQPLDTITHTIHPKAEKSELNVLISGHGWGDNNTANAAEFRFTRNYLHVNDMEYEHTVWNVCDPNPDGCQPQNGTWYFSRSGWCPGAITHPIVFDLDDYIGQDQSQFIYELDPLYVDSCHPNNPECVSGVTCPDCNAGFNPHYYISGNLVSYSNEPMADNVVSDVALVQTGTSEITISPNPGSGIFNIQLPDNFQGSYYKLVDATGNLVLTADAKNQTEFMINLENQKDGLYILMVQTSKGQIHARLIKS